MIEDEALVALSIIDMLELAEAVPLDSAVSVAEALICIESNAFDVALVDANLQGVRVDAIAAALKQRNVPFVVVTGYDGTASQPIFKTRLYFQNPSQH